MAKKKERNFDFWRVCSVADLWGKQNKGVKWKGLRPLKKKRSQEKTPIHRRIKTSSGPPFPTTPGRGRAAKDPNMSSKKKKHKSRHFSLHAVKRGRGPARLRAFTIGGPSRRRTVENRVKNGERAPEGKGEGRGPNKLQGERVVQPWISLKKKTKGATKEAGHQSPKEKKRKAAKKRHRL